MIIFHINKSQPVKNAYFCILFVDVTYMKIKLLGKNLDELKRLVAEEGLPGFTAKQIAQWLYVKKVRTIDEMTNLSKAARAKLSEKYEVGLIQYAGLQISSDGTKKYLFPVRCTHKRGLNLRVEESELEASAVEAVMIPDDDRATLCVSSQAGCRMGCKFCMTGRQGFHGHMSAADIISQFIAVDESDRLTNAVFMGMGEPLDNYDNVMRAIEILTADWGFAWSPKRITLSTIGVIPGLKRYLDECRCHLAVSLHDPFAPERLDIMPAQGAWPIQEVVDLIKQYDFTGQRRVSFEYTMFAGFNDTKAHADALIRMLRGLECRMNLIRFHKIPDFPYETSPDVIMENFKTRLNNSGIMTTIRASRGEDILAACGMLAGQNAGQKNEQ
jgi:23S rRNA (adenine2503-C2)-methyltransferase